MTQIFNFTQTTVSGSDFDFGSTGSGPYSDFNFTESGYAPSYNFNFDSGYAIYTVLKGPSNNFAAIWADTDAGLSVGKMYIGLSGYFNVISLSDQTLYDWYSESRKGRGNETLDKSDIIDLNVT
jgi:hypothetical protein